MKTLNPAKRVLLIIVIIFTFNLLVGMACGGGDCAGLNDHNCNGIIDVSENPLFEQGNVEQAVTEYFADTCPKRADGTCKAIGE